MGATKTEQYSTKQLAFARTAKAIGHPARVTIIQHLAETGMATNLEVIEVTGLSIPTVCQHLKELMTARLVVSVFVGNTHYYQLMQDAEQAVKALQFLFDGNVERAETGIKK